MFRLPHTKKSRIQSVLLIGFLVVFYFGVRFGANRIDGGMDALELQGAIARNDMEELESLLRAGANVNGRSPDETQLHRFPLQYAIGNYSKVGNLVAVELLLKYGADPDARMKGGHSPLHQAALRDSSITRMLLEHGAHPNVENDNGITPLHQAAKRGKLATVRMLLEHGAHPNVESNDGITPLHQAAQRGELATARMLVEHGARLDSPSGGRLKRTPAAIAVEQGHIEVATYLLGAADNGTLSEAYFDHLIRLAVSAGSCKTIDELFRLNSPGKLAYDVDENELLLIAVQKDQACAIHLLLDRGLDVNAANDEGDTLLHVAVRSKTWESNLTLIERGADIDARDADGKTPLYIAVERLISRKLSMLLKRGANYAIPDNDGRTPLALARELAKLTDAPTSAADRVLDLLERHIAESEASTGTVP